MNAYMVLDSQGQQDTPKGEDCKAWDSDDDILSFCGLGRGFVGVLVIVHGVYLLVALLMTQVYTTYGTCQALWHHLIVTVCNSL